MSTAVEIPQAARDFINQLPRDRQHPALRIARAVSAGQPYEWLIEERYPEIAAVVRFLCDQDLDAMASTLAARYQRKPITDEQLRSIEAGGNVPVSSRVPAIADYRATYPAHTWMQRVHLLIYPDGQAHLRIADRDAPYNAGGPDSALCDEAWSAPERSTYSPGIDAYEAFSRITCRDCRDIAERMIADCDRERPAIRDEAEILRITANTVVDLRDQADAARRALKTGS